MKNFSISFIVLLLLAFSNIVYSLEMDEKLTMRILDVSKTKKTVLVNRGLEDGLVVGDHAKFFQTVGVIARGVVVKCSPSRSVWSVYRVVKEEEIVKDRVMNMKISSPVKLTQDSSKMLSPVIPLAPGADDLQNVPDNKFISREDRDEMEALGSGEAGAMISGVTGGINSDRSLEIFGLVYFNGLGTTRTINGEEVQTGKSSSQDFSLGVEKYFVDKKSFFHDFSIFAFVHKGSQKVTNTDGEESSEGMLEYGPGVSWHFVSDAFSYGRIIAFTGASIGMGTTKDSDNATGSSICMSLALGTKYYFKNGIGLRAIIDYYRRTEKYLVEAPGFDYTIVASGPRILMGFSYKW